MINAAVAAWSVPVRCQPLFSCRTPTDAAVATFLGDQSAGKFSYDEVGQSRDNVLHPSGYTVDHNRVVLGHGETDFAHACAAVRAWRMFPEPWTRIAPTRAPIRVGETVAMLAYALGLWWLNACRIVYVIDESTPRRRFGFAYGTLHAHVEAGEERFSVELHADGRVWYDLRAFSQPRFWPVRLGKPIARALQRRFVRESQVQMRGAVEAARV